MSSEPTERPIEVEAVPLPRSGERAPPAPGQRWLAALAPVLTGFFLDVVDFATRHPLVGLVVGGAAGWWVGGKLRLRPVVRTYLALGSALYCALPGTNFLPLGTILGALTRIDLDALRGEGGKRA